MIVPASKYAKLSTLLAARENHYLRADGNEYWPEDLEDTINEKCERINFVDIDREIKANQLKNSVVVMPPYPTNYINLIEVINAEIIKGANT